MPLTFDHVIIAVDDLQTAAENYTASGFTVVPGGQHASGTTHNALIVFPNSTYLELMALTGSPRQGSGTDFSHMLQMGEGLVGYALHCDDVAREAARLYSVGIDVSEVQSGQRLRPDGVELRWQLAMAGQRQAVFFIHDDTPRNLRIPDTPDATTHPNGVTGVIELNFLVEDMPTAVDYYTRLLDQTPLLDGADRATYNLGNAYLTLTPGTTALDDAPARLLLDSTADNPPQLDPARLHNVHLEIIE